MAACAMCREHKPIILAFILLLVNGLTYGQVDLSCDTFCLSAEVTCNCTITGSQLQWEISSNDGEIGEIILRPNQLNTPLALSGQNPIASNFMVVLTDNTSETLTATMSFTTLASYGEYVIQCRVGGGSPSTIPISIPGPLFVTNFVLAGSNTQNSVTLTFSVASNQECVASYTIMSNATAPTSTTDTSVVISKPDSDPDDAIYFVSVSAVDLAGRTGDPNSPECIIFSGPNAVTFIGDVSYMNVMSDRVCVADLEWRVAQECFPMLAGYQVTVNVSGEVTMVVMPEPTTTLRVSNVFLGEMYSVTVTPSNSFGLGSPVSTTFVVPRSCPSVEGTTSPPPTSGSSCLLLTGFGGFSVRAIVGFILSTTLFWIAI